MIQDVFSWFLIFDALLGLILLIIDYLLGESTRKDENNVNSLDYLDRSNPLEGRFDSFTQLIQFLFHLF